MDKAAAVVSIADMHITHWHKVDCPNCGWVNVGLASSQLLIACPACGSEKAVCFYSGSGRSTQALPWMKRQVKLGTWGRTEPTTRLNEKARSALAAL